MSGAALRLTELHASDLRCHAGIGWQCEDGLNLLIGENGSGKTTLLEAVFLMGHGRSFRQARDPFLVRHGRSRFNIRGKWMRYGPVYASITGGTGGTEVSLQGRKLQRRDLTETLPVLVESPQSARLIDGVPAERRRWLDQMMLYCRPELLRHYQAYLRCMMQRDRLLRRRAGSGEVEVWEQQLVAHGKLVMQVREDLLQSMNRELAGEDGLNEDRLTLHLPESAPQSSAEWMDKLSEQRRQGHQVLRIGPHCDRLQMRLGKRDIRAVGSRGQQKLAGVALRLAECRLRMQNRGLLPVLLLDDCFEALDPYRRDRLVERLQAHPGQVLMTGPLGVNEGLENRMHCTVLPSVQKDRTEGQRQTARGMEEAA